MIKRTRGLDLSTIVTYVCDHCIEEMPGAPIIAYFPYGHIVDSADGPMHFCSDKCIMEFMKKLTKKFGLWKSEAIAPEEKVRSSAEFRAMRRATRTSNDDDSTKARKAVRKPTRRRKTREPNDL